jgi:hypothetical protein
MTPLEETIRRITPQYQPGLDDLRWFEIELERIRDRALPKLIRKRFVDSLRASSKSINGARSALATGSPTAKAPVSLTPTLAAPGK